MDAEDVDTQKLNLGMIRDMLMPGVLQWTHETNKEAKFVIDWVNGRLDLFKNGHVFLLAKNEEIGPSISKIASERLMAALSDVAAA